MLMYVWLVVGFVLLIKGADYFVEASSSIARALRVPGIIIGLTIVAFGTSAPELAVSTTASLARAAMKLRWAMSSAPICSICWWF